MNDLCFDKNQDAFSFIEQAKTIEWVSTIAIIGISTAWWDETFQKL